MDIRDMIKQGALDVNVEDAYPKVHTLRERVNSVGICLLVEDPKIRYMSLVVKPTDPSRIAQALANHEELLSAIGEYRTVVLDDTLPPTPRVPLSDVPAENVPIAIARAIAWENPNRSSWLGTLVCDNGELLPSRVNFLTDQMILTNEYGHSLVRTRTLPSGITVTLD